MSAAGGDPIEPSYVSCGADRLYNETTFPGSAERYAEICRNEPAGQFVCDLFPSFAYERPVEPSAYRGSPAFAALIHQKRAALNTGKAGPASALFRLNDVIIRDRVIYLRRGEDFPVVYETFRPIDRESSTLASLDALRNPREGISDETPVFFIGSTGDFNYGHWVSDDLTRLSAFQKVRETHPNEHIVILLTEHGGAIDLVREQSIHLLLSADKNFSIRRINRSEAIFFRSIYHASPVTYFGTLKSPEATLWLQKAAFKTLLDQRSVALRYLPVSRASRRLFIDRGPGTSRNLANGADVSALLQSQGFERHTLEGMSFREQVELFSEAAFVVGNMGAAMVNTIFCHKGTPIVYLIPEGWDDPFYWDLAAVLRQPHYALYGASSGRYFIDDFSVDVEALHGVLAEIKSSQKFSRIGRLHILK